MNKKTIWAVIVIVVVILVIWGMTKDSKKVSEESVTVGSIVFVTGDQASLGEEVRNTLILANEEVSSKTKINLLIEDSKDDPKEALGIYNKFKAQNVPVIISTGDQVSYALSPVTNQDKIPLLMTVTAATETAGDYTFRAFITAKQQAELMGNYSVDTLNYKKPALLYVNNIFGESYKNTLSQTLRAKNVELLSAEAFGIVDMDMKTQITKIIASKPDVIFIAGFGPSYTVIFNQIRQFGWKGDILTVNTLGIPYFFNSISTENRDKIYFTDTAFSLDNPTNDKMKAFIKSYKSRFNTDPSFIGAFTYDLYSVLSEVINKCGSASEAIKKCMSEVKDRNGVLGNVGFSNQEMHIPLFIKKVVNGGVESVKEVR